MPHQPEGFAYEVSPAEPRPGSLAPEAQAALEEVLARDDPAILGVVLTGSAARGIPTEHSDVDVYVVLTDEARVGRTTSHGRYIDEIPQSLADLEDVPQWGGDEWGYRWGFCRTKVLRDETGGRIAAALHRMENLTAEEQRRMLLDGDQLDGYINMAYRALKSDRDGRPLERRLDAAESVHWWLDVVFTLSGRVRPYNKYLAWELREHALSVPEWSADRLLPQVEAVLDGDADAVRAAYAVVERECRPFPHLWEQIESWGDELLLIRGSTR
ncbi:MAG: nucleotidyltransferase domain-containing protein [Nocardioides sp.]